MILFLKFAVLKKTSPTSLSFYLNPPILEKVNSLISLSISLMDMDSSKANIVLINWKVTWSKHKSSSSRKCSWFSQKYQSMFNTMQIVSTFDSLQEAWIQKNFVHIKGSSTKFKMLKLLILFNANYKDMATFSRHFARLKIDWCFKYDIKKDNMIIWFSPLIWISELSSLYKFAL